MNHTTDAIIFDLDGTLWDCTPAIAEAWNAAIDQFDFVDHKLTADDVRGVAGMPHDEIYEKLFPELSQQQRQTLQELSDRLQMENLREKGGKLYEGVEATLEKLQKKYKLFIVSNCQLGYIDDFLAFHGLQRFFTDHACYGDNHRPKGENIEAVIKRNNLKAAVYVGDTAGDFEASQAAGVPFIYARYGFGEVPATERYIDRFADLLTLF
ncbi:HAD family hydrolase [Pontibacter sp. E15-1]|uniref:HAD family hydrolase n=1 Tax=Pontibacter sp. E15-1 TaxID=2919918 RepID=UPI001F4F33A3|nr:HAD family hydrolase [Pontibacter sp. E15-1]MCJ8164457.1 HAD family hydrolase [Pontibacter sp. E15-1]